MKKILFLAMAVMAITGCSKDENEERVVTGITINEPPSSIKIGDTTDLTVSHTPSDLPAPTYIWESSDSKVATVENGKVTGASVGKVTITVRAKDLALKSICEITVTPIKAESIKLSSSQEQLKVGEQKKISYTILPENTTDKAVEWSSDNVEIATITDGNITAISPGETFVNIKIKGTDVSDKCKVVISPIEVTEIQLSETAIKIEKNRTHAITATVLPENATNKDVNWTSSDNTVATVINGEIKGIGIGTCVISATSKEGNVKGECSVEVVPVKVTGVTTDNTPIKVLEGAAFTIRYNILPEDAANKKVTMGSSDNNIVSVNPDGTLTAKAVGSATVTITTEEGGFTGNVNVNVVDITAMMRLYFQSSSIVSINGYVTGSMYSAISNTSTKDVKLTRFEVKDSSSNVAVLYTTDEAQLGTLSAGSTKSLGGRLNSVYNPVFTWFFQYGGKDYSVSHTYR